jgi:hypothetical protein
MGVGGVDKSLFLFAICEQAGRIVLVSWYKHLVSGQWCPVNNQESNLMTNLNPMAIDLPSTLFDLFDGADDAIATASVSTDALMAGLADIGVRFSHMSKPSKDASPEHKFGYCAGVRLGIHKLARVAGVPDAAFAPVYNGSVNSTDTVTIGDKTLTVRKWKQAVSDALRPVKTAMERLAREQVAQAKEQAGFAAQARVKARAKAEEAEAAWQAARGVAEKAEAEAAKAEAEAEEAPKGQRAQAKAVAARKRAEADARVAEVAGLFDHAEEAQETELACMSEVELAEAEVKRLEAELGAKPKAAQAPKTDAEKWHAALRKLLGDVKGAVSPTGEADVPDVVAGIEAAIAACHVVISE